MGWGEGVIHREQGMVNSPGREKIPKGGGVKSSGKGGRYPGDRPTKKKGRKGGIFREKGRGE